MDACAPDDTACVSAFFRNTTDYSGVSGDMIFNPDGSLTRPFGIKHIKDGAFVWVARETG